MKTVLFSAFFMARDERMAFMSRVRSALGQDVRVVLFNLAGDLSGPDTEGFEVANAASGFRPSMDQPLDKLRAELSTLVPGQEGFFITQACGEFDEGGHPVHGHLVNLVHRVRTFREAIDRYAPDHVFLWNQFNTFHRIAAATMEARGIGVGYFHDGLLPGSIALDVDGEMGNSWIARQPERFLDVEVNDDDLARAERFLDNLTGQEVNARHQQNEHILVGEALEQAGLSSRPVLFFAGQNDWHAGIKPAGPDKPNHSPFFDGSPEALHALDKMGNEVGFSVLYKPHPLSRDRFLFLEAEDFPNSLILKSTSLPACMEASSLVSTIASQTCYVALLQGHPVLMLGRNQISDKGLTYEINTLDDLPEAIARGVDDPLAATRRRDLIRHVAQLERCYLLDYGTSHGDGYYRRGAESFARIVRACLDHEVGDIIEMQIAGERS